MNYSNLTKRQKVAYMNVRGVSMSYSGKLKRFFINLPSKMDIDAITNQNDKFSKIETGYYMIGNMLCHF